MGIMNLKRCTKFKEAFSEIDAPFKVLYFGMCKTSGVVTDFETGVKFTLNFVYFSAKLWKNIQAN